MGQRVIILGKRFAALRRERYLTQEEFAEVIGVSVDFLGLIERGINAPSFERLEQIAERLDISVAALFTFTLPTPRGAGSARRRLAK